MDRRTFTQATILGGLAAGRAHSAGRDEKTHVLTLSFDDGFRKSFLEISDIYESFGLHACLNVIASGHLPGFKAVDNWILPKLMGDFDDWNTLKKRGHEIMPHSWQHLNLARQPLEKAKELIARCLDYFEEHLDGYQSSNAVFNFPFNSSSKELEEFTLLRVRAVRTGGAALNPIPTSSAPLLVGCVSNGPKNNDAWVEKQLEKFLSNSGGWLVLNLHGLDNEGWGPISKEYLVALLNRLTKRDHLEILPAGEFLARSSD